jgi:hypothetical protein
MAARSQRFLQQAESALIAAIEIYNKPDFRYREQSFSILALNAWELLLKARLLHLSDNDPKSLYVYETRQSKKGRPTKKRYLKKNRAGNPQTLSLGQTILALEKRDSAPPSPVRRNLDALIEIRDNSVHYIAAGPLLAKQVLEVGTASVANFIRLAREWFNNDLSKYHLYLMPIGFISPPKEGDSIVATSDEANVVQFITSLMQSDAHGQQDENYSVALTLQLKMKRSTSEAATKVAITDDPNAPKVFLSEAEFKGRYPWDYGELTTRLKKRYVDFKVAQKYHTVRRPLMKDSKYCMSRFLDPGNPKSAKKDFYNPDIVHEFDKHYDRSSGTTITKHK